LSQHSRVPKPRAQHSDDRGRATTGNPRRFAASAPHSVLPIGGMLNTVDN
jgi:hypothetical protein